MNYVPTMAMVRKGDGSQFRYTFNIANLGAIMTFRFYNVFFSGLQIIILTFLGERNGKGGKRHYERWLFAMRYAAFCNAKGLINRERKKFAYSAERFC